jgi:quercetin 2,3-dioxygenase
MGIPILFAPVNAISRALLFPCDLSHVSTLLLRHSENQNSKGNADARTDLSQMFYNCAGHSPMSNLLPSTTLEECSSAATLTVGLEALPQRQAQIGSLDVHRVLPVRGRRLIGPWCFFDHYGPLTFTSEKPLDVAPHPHIGLQTVSWLIEGEIVHNDSLGSQCLVGERQLSLMTAGRGIAHAEETPSSNSGRLNGVQLWLALPDPIRAASPEYQCTKELPVLEEAGGLVTVIVGELAGHKSPGRVFSPTIGADVAVHRHARLHLPLDTGAEHGLMLISGSASIEGLPLDLNTLYYVGAHGGELTISSDEGARLILIGGAPFGETIVMWWNFVARTHEEIAEAKRAWENHEVFGDVPRYQGPRLPAPPMFGRPISGRS